MYRGLGISVIRLRPRSKQPHGPWQEFTRRLPTREEINSWFAHADFGEPNIGGVMGRVSGYVAIDADNRPDAQRLQTLLPATSMVTVTPRGAHFIFRIRPDQIVRPRVNARVLGVPGDVRGEDSYVTLAESLHPCGDRYKRLGSWDPAHAPFFDETWIDDPPATAADAPSRRRGVIRGVSQYLARVESIQGRHGSAGLVRGCAIYRDAGLSEAEATVELMRWNQLPVVAPPWSDHELARAVTRVFAKQA